MAGNTIDFNDGRGLDILYSGIGRGVFGASSGTLDVVFTDNVINSNNLEGVYFVTTASGEQTQNTASYNPLDIADGDISYLTRYFVTFDGRNNEIISNGVNVVSGEVAGVNADGSFDGTGTGDSVGDADNSSGFVVRVGTAGGGYNFNSNGGFANEAEIISNTQFATETNALRPATVSRGLNRGGLDMILDGNTFSGNFGSDLFFSSFTSTVDPPGTTGTWENEDPEDDTFNVNNYEGDPLARLDLTLRDNLISKADPTNVGAFYNNDDGSDDEFKSRLRGDDDNMEPGPFTAATRHRNAQRTAIRLYPDVTVNPGDPNTPFGSTLNPQIPNSDGYNFRYPGLGDSTFRVNVSDLSAADVFQLETLGFIFDDNPIVGGAGNAAFDDLSPIETVFEQNGILRANTPGDTFFDEAFYGWGTFGTPDGFVPPPQVLDPGQVTVDPNAVGGFIQINP